ncbi:MAG: Hsp20/alpha crystallin family protein [Calditrichia bacterium]
MFYNEDQFGQAGRYGAMQAEENGRRTVKPRVDVYETDKAVVVLAEMPDVPKENLSVKVENGFLHLKGERKEKQDKGQYLMREFPQVTYERIFELEDNLNPEKISASYEYGIVKLEIAKKEKKQPKIIEIQ